MKPLQNTLEIKKDTKEAIKDYHKDGASVVRGVLSLEWISLMRKAVQRILDQPGNASVEYTPAGEQGRFYGDFFLWRQDADFEKFMRFSPLPELVATVMESSKIHFFYDPLLVKEPKTKEITPWHQDLPYWPLRGPNILSIWVPFDPINCQNGGVSFIKGSHRWKERYAPTAFGKDSGFGEIYEKMGWEPLPDFEKEKKSYCWLNFATEPGDVIIFHPLTIHGSGGNLSVKERRRALAMRYFGDDTLWDSRPGTFIEKDTLRDLLPGLNLNDGDVPNSPLFPLLWPS